MCILPLSIPRFLSRELGQTIIVDNSPMSYIFHPQNAIDCGSFIDDPADIEMWQLADFLVAIRDCVDVRDHCRYWREWCSKNPSTIPSATASMVTAASQPPQWPA
jgi:TFIIF-interacting CTD phosphatase-like protein